MAANVVCISHTSGAGGDEVGRLVAERLGYLHVDDEIVARAAAAGGLHPGDVADAERRQSFVARFLDVMAQGSAGEAWGLGAAGIVGVGGTLGGDDVRVLIRETIEQTAARGNVVIVAHAASQAVERGPAVLRVLVTASPATRAARLGGGETDGARAVRDADASRRDYLKRFYGIDDELPTHYDLVVNTDVLTVDDAAALVSQAASG